MASKVAEAEKMEPSYGMDKLSSKIFAVLESKFLFGSDDKKNTNNSYFSPAVTPLQYLNSTSGVGRVRLLSIDAGGATEGLLAAASLALLESSLQHLTGDTSVRIADFFDIAAGSGVGGVLTALLFSPSATDSRSPLSAAQVLCLFVKHHHSITVEHKSKKNFLRKIFGGGKKNQQSNSFFCGLFGDMTLKDTAKPVLIPCYDLTTGAPFVFSRADAVETDRYDFRMRDVCAATMGMAIAASVTSIDGRTRITAAKVDGGVATGNPASAAITHVLNNKMEFPFVSGLHDVFLVSIGNGEASACGNFRQPGYATPSPAGIMKITGDEVSNMIDQAVAMAFGQSRPTNYVRIQGREQRTMDLNETTASQLLHVAEEMLAQRNVESVLFRGKKLSEGTNSEKLDWVAVELLKEGERRKKSPLPVVVFKRGSPRSSSSSSSVSASSVSSP